MEGFCAESKSEIGEPYLGLHLHLFVDLMVDVLSGHSHSAQQEYVPCSRVLNVGPQTVPLHPHTGDFFFS